MITKDRQKLVPGTRALIRQGCLLLLSNLGLHRGPLRGVGAAETLFDPRTDEPVSLHESARIIRLQQRGPTGGCQSSGVGRRSVQRQLQESGERLRTTAGFEESAGHETKVLLALARTLNQSIDLLGESFVPSKVGLQRIQQSIDQ